MILSILIPTLYKRAEILFILIDNIERQIKECNAVGLVEILPKLDGGEIPTGTKRNQLVLEAVGKYVVHVDDDDDLPGYYIRESLEALKMDPDALAINGYITHNGMALKRWFISKDLNYCAIRDASGVETYHRYNNHLSATRRSIALQIKYPDIWIGEDYSYALALHNAGLIKTEVMIEKPMYHYKFNSLK